MDGADIVQKKETTNITYYKCITVADTQTLTTDDVKQSEEYLEYRKLADKIQKDIYDANFRLPRDSCLKDCEKWIKYDVEKKVYNFLFAECEGEADTLRTTSRLTEDLPKHDIYRCLKKLAVVTSFPKVANMIYKFRKAAAFAVAGETDKAIKKSDDGYETLQLFLGNKEMAKTNASCLYGYVNVHLSKLSAEKDAGNSGEQKDKIFFLITKGLEQAELIEERDTMNMWARMFLVKKAFCFLNIGLKGEDIYNPEGLHITDNDRRSANECLVRAKESHWAVTDKRRVMLRKRAQAKMFWIEGNRSTAMQYLRKAVGIAIDFKREEEFFQEILRRWEEDENEKVKKQKLDSK